LPGAKMRARVCKRGVVLRNVQQVCVHRGGELHAADVQSNHVHAVIRAEHAAERVMNEIKAWSTRRLVDEQREGEKETVGDWGAGWRAVRLLTRAARVRLLARAGPSVVVNERRCGRSLMRRRAD
jgi:hypothetical protein